tara:strand:+ start:250 stop:507 length:258 start_codon:yes stop_codon:yes gene_type:complete
MSIELNNDTPLKQLIVDFVGNKIQPENDEVTIEHIAEVFSEQFPEFLLTLAEENWVNGYTQALTDVDFVKQQMKNKDELEKSNKK